MAQNWNIDPKTGDYLQQSGVPVLTDALTIPAYYRLKVKRTQWLYAPNTRYGSDFYTVNKRFNPNDTNPLVNMAEVALQPIIDDGRASSVDAAYLAPKGLNDTQLSVVITDAQGTPQTLNLPVVGG